MCANAAHERRRIVMLDRRRALKAGIAALGSLSVAAPFVAAAQPKPGVKVRYNEVVRSVLYAPAYIAITKGYFTDAGIDVALTTAQGGDRSMAALLSNDADIALMGPEAAIYVINSESPLKPRVFCGLTATSGFSLISRNKIDKFDWNMLKGKEILGFRPGSTPLLFFEKAMRIKGLDPQKDVKLQNNVAIPARVGAWLAGQYEYGIFDEPEVSQFELDGKGHFLASHGEIVGAADYTAFMATDKYIREHADVLQQWTNAIYRAQKWMDTAPTAEIVQILIPFFQGRTEPALTAGVDRFRKLKIWKGSPVIEPGPIEKFQDILVEGHVLDAAKRVKFQDLIRTEFATKAK
jgi:NitT/TauT family transport system substrate-binding protein